VQRSPEEFKEFLLYKYVKKSLNINAYIGEDRPASKLSISLKEAYPLLDLQEIHIYCKSASQL